MENEPNGDVFMLAISLGLRRGEVLGLPWAGVGLDAGRPQVRRQPERRNWLLGCADLVRCVEKQSQCPQRWDCVLVLAGLKTKQSRGPLPLPEPLLVALRQHRRRQREARIHAGMLWRDCGLVFTTVTGRPVAPRDHSLHWTAFLQGLGIRPARLHDARHAAATLLLVWGVDHPVVMSRFGRTDVAGDDDALPARRAGTPRGGQPADGRTAVGPGTGLSRKLGVDGPDSLGPAQYDQPPAAGRGRRWP